MQKFWHNDNADAGMIGGIIALLVSIIIGVLIWYKINPLIFTANYVAGKNQNAINTTWAAVNASANTSFTLMPIVAIVVVASVILMVVTGFGRGQA